MGIQNKISEIRFKIFKQMALLSECSCPNFPCEIHKKKFCKNISNVIELLHLGERDSTNSDQR